MTDPWWRRSGGMLRRLVAYSLGSVVAATIGELAFVTVYGWLGAGNVAASAAGFVGGFVPNYVVNRWVVWADRRGRRTRSETALYVGVAAASFVSSVAVTGWAEGWARSLSSDRAWRVALVAAAYLAVAGVFFVAKFVAFHVLVFTPATPAVTGARAAPTGPAGPPRSGPRWPARSTTSRG